MERHKGDLRPEERTGELERELSLIEEFAGRVGGIVDEITNHAVDFGLNCSNDALQKLKASSSEIDKYSTEFFWTLMKLDRARQPNSPAKVKLPSSAQERN